MTERTVHTRGPAETEALAGELSRALRAGDRVLLHGDLGGGKTTFVRGLVRGLGHPDPREVCSPTFALHHRYPGGRIPVDHLDLYRLDGGPGMALQGVLDPLEDPDSLTVVEWPERLPSRPQDVVLDVYLRREGDSEDARSVRLVFGGRLASGVPSGERRS